MADSSQCPQCGMPLSPESPHGLCPECLLRQGLANHKVGPESVAATEENGKRPSFQPPLIEELSPRFPQLEILELLGHGGMGAVYKARQKSLDRVVALKVLPGKAGQDPAFAERFAREARAMAKLMHPNIVMVFEFGDVDGLYYLLMEYVEGVNLRQAMRTGEITAEQALALVPQVCEALQYAHEEGIVHRDIKPENVMLDKRGRVKIADFGLAKLLQRSSADVTLTSTNQVIGTFNYMAPEQIEKPLEVDHRADIYSLGVVFYELLTGELPLGRYKLPSERAKVDERLDRVVLKSLEREPDRRYQHASDVKTDVDTIRDGNSKPRLSPTPTPASAMATAEIDLLEGGGQTSGAAIALIVAGIINLVPLLFSILAVVFVTSKPPGVNVTVVSLFGLGFPFLLGLPMGVVLILAGLCMKRLAAYDFVKIVVIFACIPFTPLWIVNIFVAFYALQILGKDEIKQAFRSQRRRIAEMRALRFDSRGTLSSPAMVESLEIQRRLNVPTLVLIVAAAVNIVPWVFAFVFSLFEGRGPGLDTVVFAMAMLLTVGLSSVTIVGAWNIRNLGSYTLSVLGCFVAALPLGVCWFVTLPLSIWLIHFITTADVKAVFGNASQTNTSDSDRKMVHPGMIALGVVMIVVAVLMLFNGFDQSNDAYIWCGVGVILGGGGVIAGAFSPKHRILAGSKPNVGLLVMGFVMVVVGLVLFGIGFDGRDEALFWAGFGITIGGGGCFAGAWDSKQKFDLSSFGDSIGPLLGKPQLPATDFESSADLDLPHGHKRNIVWRIAAFLILPLLFIGGLITTYVLLSHKSPIETLDYTIKWSDGIEGSARDRDRLLQAVRARLYGLGGIEKITGLQSAEQFRVHVKAYDDMIVLRVRRRLEAQGQLRLDVLADPTTDSEIVELARQSPDTVVRQGNQVVARWCAVDPWTTDHRDESTNIVTRMDENDRPQILVLESKSQINQRHVDKAVTLDLRDESRTRGIGLQLSPVGMQRWKEVSKHVSTQSGGLKVDRIAAVLDGRIYEVRSTKGIGEYLDIAIGTNLDRYEQDDWKAILSAGPLPAQLEPDG